MTPNKDRGRKVRLKGKVVKTDVDGQNGRVDVKEGRALEKACLLSCCHVRGGGDGTRSLIVALTLWCALPPGINLLPLLQKTPLTNIMQSEDEGLPSV